MATKIDHIAYLRHLRGRLAAHKKSTGSDGAVNVSEAMMETILPPYWRDERCGNSQEWFIRTCRGLGLHANWNWTARHFIVRLTRDERDEALITWPGKAA